MNKKGFTLIELLAVIVILALIAVIVYPNVTKVISDAKKDTKTIQYSTLLKSAKTYVAKHSAELNDNSKICITDLKKEGLLENTKIVDPENDTEYKGCFTITWNSEYNQYDYTYDNSDTND